MSFIDPQPITAPRRAFVHPARKDGRHPVTFVFPISGKTIKKLIPASELEATIAGYQVIHVR